MSAPQMKERPASMLRSMFAGLGSLLNVMDKVRSKPAKPETTAAPPAAAGPEASPEPQVTPETLAEAEDTVADVEGSVTEDTIAGDTVAGDTVAGDTGEPEIVLFETDVITVETDPVTGEPEAVIVDTEIVALPLVNYDELSVASLRARLRNLSVGQLTELLDYEKTHAARPDVISMFERRIAKVQAES